MLQDCENFSFFSNIEPFYINNNNNNIEELWKCDCVGFVA